ncbi:acyl-ACP--UDP-N-acetylglucosamine O-acyltransferase [Simiduia sp. 21SJ11W-1]|uniref:acyl-ACP--UDP-N-acetylglucosamine O-acyltransferase n=1 Tax=Simiduia sp. 21SJ11W-1 TaxID=2909669 RepID=UPI0020A17FCF|nr:acyl-ACP--UDP-N-acetylglucosamine O-acyltransferase [Simiduia sp. 21SJ11W-1]UTA46738.1 acyl-ACP--UDP-N-acetylglucosamine O-acyltransferase [Simiduia sp. 21SJ11W-1]
MIHPTAIIDPTAHIAEGVTIGPYTVVGAHVRIESGTRVGSHVAINGPVHIGRDNRIFQFASIGEEPQDLSYKGEATRLEIGDRNTIREYVSFNRGTPKGGGLTKIGSDNLFMAYCHIGHDSAVGNKNVFANSASLAGHVTVGDQCILGGFTLVHQFTSIGSHAFTSMGAAINRDVPPFVIVSGNYARSYGINKVGLKRKGFSAECIAAILKAYKVLVRQRTSQAEAEALLAPLASEFDAVAQFMEFVRTSNRGIVK